jgi:hypothetical protein
MQERLAELDLLRKYLEEAVEAVDKAVALMCLNYLPQNLLHMVCLLCLQERLAELDLLRQYLEAVEAVDKAYALPASKLAANGVFLCAGAPSRA